MGQAVHEETIIGNYKTVDLSKLNNGVYFVTVKITEGTITKRIIINK